MITAEEGQKLINQVDQINRAGGINVASACLVLATEILNLIEPAATEKEPDDDGESEGPRAVGD